MKFYVGNARDLHSLKDAMPGMDYLFHAAGSRDLNYDKFVVKGDVHTMADESYTSHNTNRLDVQGTVEKVMTTDYIKEPLAVWGK